MRMIDVYVFPSPGGVVLRQRLAWENRYISQFPSPGGVVLRLHAVPRPE